MPLLQVFRSDRKARIFGAEQVVQVQLRWPVHSVQQLLQAQIAQVAGPWIWFVEVVLVRVPEAVAAPLAEEVARQFVAEEVAVFSADAQQLARAEVSRLDACPLVLVVLQLVAAVEAAKLVAAVAAAKLVAAVAAAKLVAELVVPLEAKQVHLVGWCVRERPRVWGWRPDVVRRQARLCLVVVASLGPRG